MTETVSVGLSEDEDSVERNESFPWPILGNNAQPIVMGLLAEPPRSRYLILVSPGQKSKPNSLGHKAHISLSNRSGPTMDRKKGGKRKVKHNKDSGMGTAKQRTQSAKRVTIERYFPSLCSQRSYVGEESSIGDRCIHNMNQIFLKKQWGGFYIRDFGTR
ncbi:hypothetical protein Ancab_021683 [Ancistrocladus abbreviatus]